MECNVRSLGRDSIDKNDFGEHKRSVSHQATTKAKIPGMETIMIDMGMPATDWPTKLKGSVDIGDPTVLGGSSMAHSYMGIKTYEPASAELTEDIPPNSDMSDIGARRMR